MKTFIYNITIIRNQYQHIMILTKKVNVIINPRNINHYKKHGLLDIKIKDNVLIDVKLLPKQSRILVSCKCTNCNNIKDIRYSDFNKITNNGTSDYYCKNCKSVKTKITNQEKYGVDNVFQLDSVKKKIKKTILNKYGVEHHLQTDKCLDKLKNTNNKKYGVDYVQQNKNVRKKTEKTSLEKYGHKTSLMNDEIKEKINSVLLNKYNTIYPLRNKEIKDKYFKTRINNIKDKYKGINIIDVKGDIYTVKCDNNKDHVFEITSTLLYHRKIRYKTICCTICNKINSKNISGLETEFYNFINDNYNSDILINDRNILSGKELDIYLPGLKIAFEFNGTYWHNELYKSKNYHKEKTDLCEKLNIQLIQIYEDDWLYKKDIVESIILNKLGKSVNRIYGRKTVVKEIKNNKLVKEFLDKNHIQGNVNSSIKLGLFYDGELISLMTFGKLRKPLNSKSKSDEYEMLRFCNKLNTTVIGGASKLFKYFLRNYNPNNIISYADKSHSNGNLYIQLGFDLSHITPPNYYYVINGIRYNRYNFRKDILVSQGFDKGLTEHEIMNNRGYYRIYNSGNYKFEYKKRE